MPETLPFSPIIPCIPCVLDCDALLHEYGEGWPAEDRGRGSCLDVGFTCANIGQFPVQLAAASQRSGSVCIRNIDEPAGTTNAENGEATTARTSTMAAHTVFLIQAIGSTREIKYISVSVSAMIYEGKSRRVPFNPVKFIWNYKCIIHRSSPHYTSIDRLVRTGLNSKSDVSGNCSTSPTGSENHLSPLRFQTFNRKVF